MRSTVMTQTHCTVSLKSEVAADTVIRLMSIAIVSVYRGKSYFLLGQRFYLGIEFA